ncbi:hypothetical protein BGX34_009289 [Mortierella sp. NVP85]|nr:hypothetical protein BGX34_009289 [Mortierella sp. NVP85]
MTEGFHHAHVERAKAALHAFQGWILTRTHQQDHLGARVSSYLNSLLQGRGSSVPDDFLKPPPPTYADSFGHAFRALFAASLRFVKARGQTLLHEWDPASKTDSLLWNYTPDLHAMPHRIDNEIKRLSATYEVDPKVVWLVLALPGVLLLLIVGAVMVARNRPLDGKGASKAMQKQMPKSRRRRASTRSLQMQAGWNSRRRDHDTISWESVIGASGFYGAELQDHTPYPHLVGEDLGQLPPGNSGIRTKKLSAAGETLAAIATRCMADTSLPSYQRPTTTPKGKSLPFKSDHPPFMDVERNDDGMNHDPFEFMPLPSNVKRDDRRERTAGMMETTSSKDEHARRAAVHRRLHASSSGSFAQAHQQQAPTDSPMVMGGRSTGSKVIDWTKGNQILHDMDAISGGLLGTAFFPVAALATTAKVSAGYIKKYLPGSTAGIKGGCFVRMRAEQPSNGEDQTTRKAVLEIIEQDNMAANSFPHHGVSEKLTPSFIGPMSYAQAVACPFRPGVKSHAVDVPANVKVVPLSYPAVVDKDRPMSYAAVAAKGIPLTYTAVVAKSVPFLVAKGRTGARTSKDNGLTAHNKEPQTDIDSQAKSHAVDVCANVKVVPLSYASVVAKGIPLSYVAVVKGIPFLVARGRTGARTSKDSGLTAHDKKLQTDIDGQAKPHTVDVRANVKVVPLSYAAAVAKGIPLSYTAVVVKGIPFLIAKGCTGARTSKDSNLTAHDKEPQTDINGQAKHSNRHEQRHTHHLVVHPHGGIKLAHHHHDGQGTVTEGQDLYQKRRRKGHVFEYTLDEHGYKVPMTNERRDSGFMMLA